MRNSQHRSYIRPLEESFNILNHMKNPKKNNISLSHTVSTINDLANSKGIVVHQFDQCINMIFRPKNNIKTKLLQRPQTQRINNHQRNKEKNTKTSSLEKSFSFFKRIKDYIVPTSISLFKRAHNSLTKNQKDDSQQNSITNDTIVVSEQKKLENHNQRNSLTQTDFKYNEEQNENNQSFQIQVPQITELSVTLEKSINSQTSSKDDPSSKIISKTQRSVKDNKINKKNDKINSSKQSQKSSRSSKVFKRPNILQFAHIEGKKLKYFYVLSQFTNQSSTGVYLLVGNQNQVDCIFISKLIKEQLFDTDLLWSISLSKSDSQKGQISSLAFDPQKGSYLSLLSNDLKVIQIYKYRPKQLQKKPILINSLSLAFPVRSAFSIKQTSLLIIYENKYVQIYQIVENNELKKKYQKQMESKIFFKKNQVKQLQILHVGQPFLHSITVYLCCDDSESTNSQLFDLFIVQINFGQPQYTMSKPHKVYSINKKLKNILKFDNFSKKFFLLNLGLQIFAVMKQGYMVDSAKVDIQLQKSLLKYMGRNRLLLVSHSKIEEYEFILNEKITPYRLEIRSLDSILLPQNYDRKRYEFFEIGSVFTSSNSQKNIYSASSSQIVSNYIICLQIDHSFNNKSSTGEVSYLIAMTKCVQVSQKIRQLFDFEGNQITQVDIKEIEEKVDIAKKIGLKQKDIYLQLWNRTKKTSIEDFCFLLDTNDYETISREIQKKLKKEAMLFTELSKIQSSCYYLLKKKVYSPQCTQADLKNFMVSHFKLQKYQFFKDVMRFCKDQKAVQSLMDNKNKHETEQKKIMFDIQAFYTYNQLELKSYLLQLFQKYFYEISDVHTSKPKQSQNIQKTDPSPRFNAKKKHYLLKIKILMNNFRFQLKIFYDEFLEDLIKLASKGETILDLLSDFEQILPKSYDGVIIEQQLQNSQTQQDKFKSELQKHYSQKIKINDNDQLINSNQLKVNKIQPSEGKLQLSRLKRSVSTFTKGQLQLQGIWRQISQGQFLNYMYLDTIETVYNKNILHNLVNDVWFKRNLYSQHDLILKTKNEILDIDKKLKSNDIFYFFIDKIFQIIDNQKVRKQTVNLIQKIYLNILPIHLRGKVQLYYKLYLQMQTLFQQSIETLQTQSHQQRNLYGLRSSIGQLYPTISSSNSISSQNFNMKKNINGERSGKAGTLKNGHQSIKKSLYQTFLPPKPVKNSNSLASFQNFLKLSQNQLFHEFIKLEFVLVGCIFHRIKPIYEQFKDGKQIFNETVQNYFQWQKSQISHLKCLLNRLNSQTREFQFQHFELYEVLVKSVMVKVQIGSQISQREYVNVQELIIYIRDIYMMNSQQISKKQSQINELIFKNQSSQQKFPQNNGKYISKNIQGLGSPRTMNSRDSLQQSSTSRISIYFNMLQCVSEHQQLFKKLNTRTSLYDIYISHINKGEHVTTLLVEILIKQFELYQKDVYDEFLDKTFDILVEAAIILNKLFAKPKNLLKELNNLCEASDNFMNNDPDNYENELFFILVWKIMSHQQFLFNGWVYNFLQNQNICKKFIVDQTLKQNLVLFMIKYRFSIDRLFVNNIKFLEFLLEILPQNNKIRKYFIAQINLVKLIEPKQQLQSPHIQINGKRSRFSNQFQSRTKQFQMGESKLTKGRKLKSKLKPMIYYPITQNAEIISIFHLESLFSLYPSDYLLTFNLQKICETVNQMQQILLEQAVKQTLEQNRNEKANLSEISIVQSQQHQFAKFQKKNTNKFMPADDERFYKFQRENSSKFIATLQRSFQQIPVANQYPNYYGNCSTPICETPFCDTPIGINHKQVVLTELQTLIKQSAQPHTFFSDVQAQFVQSVKLIKQSKSISNLFNSFKGDTQQKFKDAFKQKDTDFPFNFSKLQNLTKYYTSLPQIYEIVIKRLINSQMIKEVLVHLEKLLILSQGSGEKTNQLYIVYPLLIVNLISKQLISENKLLLVKICSHLFKEPLELLNFIKKLIGKSKIDQNQYSNSFSINQLHQFLVDYQKSVKVYKVQYVSPQKQSGKASMIRIDIQSSPQEQYKEKKRRLKKKLTIEIDVQDQKNTQSIQNPKQKYYGQNRHQMQMSRQIQYLKRPFTYQNPIISAVYINSITSDQKKFKFVEQIWTLFEKLYKEKQLFNKDFQFMILNIMLFQEPYTIVKYLQTKLKGWYFSGREHQFYGPSDQNLKLSTSFLKFKSLLTYFNELIKQPMMSPLKLLQFGKRMFYMLYSTVVERSSIEYQIRQYYDIPLNEVLPCDQFPQISPLSEIYTNKFRQVVHAFIKKEKQLRKKISASGKFIPEKIEEQLIIEQPIGQMKKRQLKKRPSIILASPIKSAISDKQQNLLEMSYNNIEDSLGLQYDVPLMSKKNQSKSSYPQQGFDPSRERQLVYSRGDRRFSAMLSNNNSAISLKTKLSPKSIRSSINPSTLTISIEGYKSKRSKSRFFPSRKVNQSYKGKKNKKSFDGMIQCYQSGDQDIIYQDQSIILQQDFHTSRQVSSSDHNQTPFVQPPKLRNDQFDNQMINSSESSDFVQKYNENKMNLLKCRQNDLSATPALFKSLQNKDYNNNKISRNLATQNLNSLGQEHSNLTFTQKQHYVACDNNRKFSQQKEQVQVQQLYTPQLRPGLTKNSNRGFVKLNTKNSRQKQQFIIEEKSQHDISKDVIELNSQKRISQEQKSSGESPVFIIPQDCKLKQPVKLSKQNDIFDFELNEQSSEAINVQSNFSLGQKKKEVNNDKFKQQKNIVNQKYEKQLTQKNILKQKPKQIVSKANNKASNPLNNELNIKALNKQILLEEVSKPLKLIIEHKKLQLKNQKDKFQNTRYKRTNTSNAANGAADVKQKQQEQPIQATQFTTKVPLKQTSKQPIAEIQKINTTQLININKTLNTQNQKINPKLKTKNLKIQIPKQLNVVQTVKSINRSSQSSIQVIISQSQKSINQKNLSKTNIQQNLSNHSEEISENNKSQSRGDNKKLKIQSKKSHIEMNEKVSKKSIQMRQKSTNHLHLKIKRELNKNNIQIFLLTELQDIHSKLNQYWQKYEIKRTYTSNTNIFVDQTQKDFPIIKGVHTQNDEIKQIQKMFSIYGSRHDAISSNKSSNVMKNPQLKSYNSALENNSSVNDKSGGMNNNSSLTNKSIVNSKPLINSNKSINKNTSSPSPSNRNLQNNSNLQQSKRRTSIIQSQTSSLQLSGSHYSFNNQSQIQLFSNKGNNNKSPQLDELDQLFTKLQLYQLIDKYLQTKIKQKQSNSQTQLPQTDILLQQIKDKLFYDICMNRLVQFYTTEHNVNLIAKIIDLVFKKKIFLTDYYYEVISKKQVQSLEELVMKVIQQRNKRTIRYSLQEKMQIKEVHMLKTIQSNISSNTSFEPSIKVTSPRASSLPKSHTPRQLTISTNLLQSQLLQKIQRLQNLLQKIPLNILQYRKKQLMLKFKPGKDMGRKYLLDILVKVFQKKKDKKLAEQVYLRLKNIIDRDIK